MTYTYDINNRLENLKHRNSLSEVIASYAYTLGPIGNRTRIDEANGISRVYQFDNLFRLTQEQVIDPANVQTYTNDYSYDAVGNRLNMTSTSYNQPAASNDYTYNTADQLLTENGVTYTYDLNGNLATKTDANGTITYEYDYDDKLVKVTSPTGAVTYQYDVDGNRVSSTTSNGTTQYLVDANRALAHVLAEYVPSGTVIASYVYADDLISMTRAGTTFYYHFDGLGSTRLLTDAVGSITDTYEYDAFGNEMARTGTTENAILFTGQQHDANVGFYYLRARYYQPQTGRFSTYDPFVGDLFVPISLHKYLYAAADPANRIDPSGEFFGLADASIAMSLRNTLANMQIDFGLGLMSAAQDDESAIWIGLAFALAIPIIGMIVRRFAKPAQDVLASGGWLRRHEGRDIGLGHTIDEHVCKSISYLRGRLGKVRSASTFFDLHTAESVIRDGFRQNTKMIADWIKAGMPGGRLEIRYAGTAEKIGVGVVRETPDLVEYSSALIVLKPNANGRGYYILTAYPVR